MADFAEAVVFDRAALVGASGDTPLNYDQKLGHLYESALEGLIEASPSLTLLASHEQVFDATGRTLGELDFLLYDQVRELHIHLELAVKFYLAVESDDGWQLPGPDPRDNWLRKLNRLRTHQLKLSQLTETQALLSSKFGVDTIKVEQLIYGCLFVPMTCQQMPALDHMSFSARIGRWLHLDQWTTHFEGVEEVLLVPKPLWPVELSPAVKSHLETISVERLKAFSAERCVMFCLGDSVTPYFLVPSTWGAQV